MKVLKIILPITLFIVFISLVILHVLSEDKKRENALNSFNLTFQGIVTKKIKLNSQGQGGIIKLRLLDNKIIYDGRPNEFYFCVVRNGYAELATTYYDKFELMDSVIIDGTQKSISIFKQGPQFEKLPIFMIDNISPFGIEVRTKHTL